jgi:hypothetical protein
LIYEGAYAAQPTINDLFGAAQKYGMIGGIHVGSSTIDGLAATTLADLQTYTPLNTPQAQLRFFAAKQAFSLS